MMYDLGFTLESLAAEIDNLYNLQEQLDYCCDQSISLKHPEPPMIVESMEDWEKYSQAVAAYDDARRGLAQLTDEVKSKIENVKSIIREDLPAEVWFKVETQRGIRWVGKETSNWPGDRGTLYIQDEEPKARLKYRVIND